MTKLDRYTVTLSDGQTFTMLANLAQASAPIKASFIPGEDDDGQLTPYQTADASHSAMRAARLVADYFDAGAEVTTVE